MSIKRSQSSTRSSSGGADGAKVGRQELFDHLKKMAETGQVFTPVDVALAIGAGEPAVSRALLGLAVEGLIEKVEAGRYRAPVAAIGELGMGEFIKVFSRASKTDTNRQRELSEIQRLKQNNDTMRARLLQAIAERDHYLALLKQHGIEPGPVVTPTPPLAVDPAVDAAPAGDSN